MDSRKSKLLFIFVVRVLLVALLFVLWRGNEDLAHEQKRVVVQKPVSLEYTERTQTLHVHVVLRTYHKSLTSTLGTLSSLVASAEDEDWLKLSIAILDTGTFEEVHKFPLEEPLSAMIRALHLSASKAVDVRVPKPIFESTSTYGYLSADAELARVLSSRSPPDYLVFCNGDTYYARDFFATVRQELHHHISVVGVSWLPSATHQNLDPSLQRDRYLKKCLFKHGNIDLNGVLLHVQALIQADASFSNKPTPCDTKSRMHTNGCSCVDERPYFVADWGLISQLTIDHNMSSTCVSSRPLYIQN